MAKNSKKTAKYDLKAADRRRDLAIRIGLTAVVMIFAVALVLYIVMSAQDKPAEGEAKSIRVTSGTLITKEGTSEPKAVLSLYEDFLCPACGNFEKQFGPTVSKLIDSGAVAADYYMVSILDRQGDGYSSRSANAAYCVADESTDAFRRFHAALYAQQPPEGVGPFPDNARLTEVARQAGAAGGVPECINSGRYEEMVKGLAAATGVNSTPTIRINGQDYDPSTPDALIAKIEEIVGDVPGLDAGAPGSRACTGTGGAMTVTAHSPAEPTDAAAADSPTGVAVGRASAVWILIAGVAGLAAALTLTVEKIEILINPDYVPSCSINPVLSCGSVMITPQASAFGFPNPLIGIVAFTVVMVTGVLALARVPLPRWYWAGLATGTLLGTAFIHWLIFQSLYRIGALCPYCMVVWAVTIPLLVVVSSIALQPQRTNVVARVLYNWRWSLVALWFTALVLLILVRFWNYWSTLL